MEQRRLIRVYLLPTWLPTLQKLYRPWGPAQRACAVLGMRTITSCTPPLVAPKGGLLAQNCSLIKKMAEQL